MPLNKASQSRRAVSGSTSPIDWIAANGVGSNAHFQELASNVRELKAWDIADFMHFMSVLHGRYPGVVDHAATKSADDLSRTWFAQAIGACVSERAFLTKLTVTAGPIHTLIGQDQCDAAVLGQRHALEMLSQSERQGCAIGSAIAYVVEWHTLRVMLDNIAIRMGVEPRQSELPSIAQCYELANEICLDPVKERAFRFGVQQLVEQHGGLWKLLIDRKTARDSF